MKTWGWSPEEISEAVRIVSQGQYQGNVILDESSHGGDTIKREGRAYRWKLRTKSGRGAGSRISHQGRHIPAACWHAHRDVMSYLFERNPHGRIKTAMADYRGDAGFMDLYPGTGNRNIGSRMSPLYAAEACEC